MRLWNWLTSTAGLPVLIAIIGILSAVIGGLIAGYFKTRGDTRNIQAAKDLAEGAAERWRKEQEFEREKLLADVRRQLFINTAHAMQRTREVLKAPHVRNGPAWELWKESVTERTDQLFMLETELRIIAPELVAPVQSAARIARLIRAAPPEVDQTEIDKQIEDVRSKSDEAMAQMRVLLGTETTAGGVVVPTRS